MLYDHQQAQPNVQPLILLQQLLELLATMLLQELLLNYESVEPLDGQLLLCI
jgi:hypothetical protein